MRSSSHGNMRQLHRLRAGRDDRVLEADQLLAFGRLDFHLVGRNEAADALDRAHLALLRHRGEAAGELADHLVLEVAQLVDVDVRLAEGDAMGGHRLGLVDHRGGMQQRLGRDAAHVEADAAEGGVALDQHGVHAQVGGTERGRVATRTGAEHDQLALDVRRACRRQPAAFGALCWCSVGDAGAATGRSAQAPVRSRPCGRRGTPRRPPSSTAISAPSDTSSPTLTLSS